RQELQNTIDQNKVASSREEFAAQVEILKLRASGSNGDLDKANALEKEVAVRREAARLQDELQISESQALRFAQDLQKLREKSQNRDPDNDRIGFVEGGSRGTRLGQNRRIGSRTFADGIEIGGLKPLDNLSATATTFDKAAQAAAANNEETRSIEEPQTFEEALLDQVAEISVRLGELEAA
ncbi:MAG: hypothetical protein AAF226_02185, partial [Verrucomicrobiota bacterium]